MESATTGLYSMTRALILGAGFSKAAGIPLTNQLMEPVCECAFGPNWENEPDNSDRIELLKGIATTAEWLGEIQSGSDFRLPLMARRHGPIDRPTSRRSNGRLPPFAGLPPCVTRSWERLGV